ncbi:MAG: hypothetical protein AB8B67_03360 [Rickettsiaceae bacterium]
MYNLMNLNAIAHLDGFNLRLTYIDNTCARFSLNVPVELLHNMQAPFALEIFIIYIRWFRARVFIRSISG